MRSAALVTGLTAAVLACSCSDDSVHVFGAQRYDAARNCLERGAAVLVVDDSPTILRVVSAILARHGYEPVVARDGLAGIEAIKKGPKPDIVLLDFVMPRMNGYQFCRELRSSSLHRTLPVVLMSAKG